MSLPASIFTKLSTDGSATAALVGTGSNCRVYPGRASDQPVMPYVVFTGVSSDDAGSSHESSNDFDQTDVQFSIITDKQGGGYASAWAIRQAIRADLADVTLAGGEKAVGFIERDGFAEGVDAYILLLDVSFWHDPSAA